MPDSSPRVARLDHHRNARLLPAARSVDRWEVNLTEPPDGHARLSHLDGLRGLAALNVMAGHAVIACDYALYSGARADSWGAWDITVSAWPLLLPVAGANFSVCVFLVLSGFVLAHAFIRTSLGPPALAVKRTVRLGLPILAVTLMSWALLAAGCGANHRVAPISHSRWLDVPFAQAPDFGAAVRDGLFGNLVLHVPNATSYDASLWTMPIEFAGSLLLIVCFWAGRSGLARAGSRRLGGLALLMAGAITYPAYVSLMLFGAALYVLRRPGPVIREKRDPLRSIRWGGLALIALVLGTVPFSEARGPYWNALAALAPPAPFAGLWPPGLPGALAMSAEAIWHGIGAVVLVVRDRSLAVRAVAALPAAAAIAGPHLVPALSRAHPAADDCRLRDVLSGSPRRCRSGRCRGARRRHVHRRVVRGGDSRGAFHRTTRNRAGGPAGPRCPSRSQTGVERHTPERHGRFDASAGAPGLASSPNVRKPLIPTPSAGNNRRTTRQRCVPRPSARTAASADRRFRPRARLRDRHG